MFKRGGARRSRVIWIAYAVIGVCAGTMVFGLCMAVYALAPVFANLDLLPELFTLVMGAACVTVILFGLAPMMSYLYFSKDTEFFLPLPVRSSTVYLAKFLFIYLTEVAVVAAFLLPVGITLGATLGLNALYYAVMLFSVIFVPAVPMLLVALLAIPLMYVVSFFKNRGALTSVVLVLLFGSVFGLYYFMLARINLSTGGEEADPIELIEGMRRALVGVCNLLPPLYAIARFALMSDVFVTLPLSVPAAMGANVALFIACVLLLLSLTVCISAAMYRKSAARMLEGSRKRSALKDYAVKSGTALSALFKKEWKELFRTPAYAFQSLSGTVLSPIWVLFISFSLQTTVGTAESVLGSANFRWFLLVGFICMVAVSMNMGAATTYSREGKMFYYAKMLPVDYITQVNAKLRLYVLISTATIVIDLIILAVLMFDWLNLLCAALFLLLYNYGFNCFCLLLDLSRPKLTWTTPNEAIKNNGNSMLTTFLNMGISVILVGLPLLAVALVPVLWLGLLLSWGFLIAAGAAAAVVFHTLLFKKAPELYRRILGSVSTR
jgi:hypothetical protein